MALNINMPFAQELITQGRARGYNDIQIAQILGSAAQENSFRTDGKPGDNGTAFGGFQWRLDREKALRDKAAQAGVDWTDPRIQATHWYDELDTGQESPRGRALRAAQTHEEAQRAVIAALRPAGFKSHTPEAGHGWSNRLNNGRQIYAMLTGGGGGGGGYNPDADKPARGAFDVAMEGDGGEGKPGFVIPGGDGRPIPPRAEPSAWDKLKNFLTGGKEWSLADGLQGAGIAAMARDNPAGASAMANGVNALKPTKVSDKFQDYQEKLHYNPETGTVVMRDKRTGAISEQKVATPFKKISDKEFETFHTRQDSISRDDYILRNTHKLRNQIANGEVDVSLWSQGEDWVKGITDQSDQKARNTAALKSHLESIRNSMLTDQNGVQTRSDEIRFMDELIKGVGKYDNAMTMEALDRIMERTRRGAEMRMKTQESLLDTYGQSAPKGSYRDDYNRQRLEYQKFDDEFAPRREEFKRRRNAPPPPPPEGNRPGPARPEAQPKSGGGGSLSRKILQDNGR